MSHKIFDNNIVAIRKSKYNKPAYTGMCILELNKVLICEFHYDYIRYDNKSKLILADNDV